MCRCVIVCIISILTTACVLGRSGVSHHKEAEHGSRLCAVTTVNEWHIFRLFKYGFKSRPHRTPFVNWLVEWGYKDKHGPSDGTDLFGLWRWANVSIEHLHLCPPCCARVVMSVLLVSHISSGLFRCGYLVRFCIWFRADTEVAWSGFDATSTVHSRH